MNYITETVIKNGKEIEMKFLQAEVCGTKVQTQVWQSGDYSWIFETFINGQRQTGGRSGKSFAELNALRYGEDEFKRAVSQLLY